MRSGRTRRRLRFRITHARRAYSAEAFPWQLPARRYRGAQGFRSSSSFSEKESSMEANSAGINRGVSTGFALAVTVGIAYTACALAFGLWPEAGIRFMNSLFHGLDFRKLQAGAVLFDFGNFFFALIVLMVWAFVLGLVYG